MHPTVGKLVVGFILLAILFTIVERLFPANSKQRWWRRGFRTDLAYWFFTPFVAKPLAHGVAIVLLVLGALTLGAPRGREGLEAWYLARGGPFSHHPPALQALETLFFVDFLGYLGHRWLHGRTLFRFHAVHHGPTELDWLSSVRVHPVNEIVGAVVTIVPLGLLGVRPGVLAGAIPFFTLYALFLHANVPWTYGPLRYVIASPAFHRWHHTSQEEGLDKNFAGLFPFIDLLFGTFYMPKARLPERFGITGEAVPEGFFAQLWYPFRRGAGGSARLRSAAGAARQQ